MPAITTITRRKLLKAAGAAATGVALPAVWSRRAGAAEQIMVADVGGAPGQAVLALSARYGKDLPPINAGLVWRIFSDRPDDTGTFKMIREDRNATPNVVLPPGNYVVHVAFGLVSAVRAVTLKAEALLIDATAPTFRVLGRQALLADEDGLYSHPALAGTTLYVRGSDAVYAFELKP